jgi:hypothetical protein
VFAAPANKARPRVATRRKYVQRFRDGGAVNPDNHSSATIPDDPVPQADATRPAASDDPIRDQLAHLKRAEQLQIERQQQPQLSPWKQDFLRANPELVEDEEATYLTRYHYLAALRRGIRDDTPEMNQAILSGFKRMRGAVEEIGHKPEREAPPVNAPPARSVPYSAPVARSAPSASGGSVSRQITLDPGEREMAWLSYRDLPRAEAERLYASMKHRLLAAKANGTHD